MGARVYHACAEAERRGLMERTKCGRGPDAAVWALTPTGRQYFENRLVLRVLKYTVVDARAGRPFGTGAKLVATWLAALPDTNEIRLNAQPT